jgi:predicted Zn-dependent protease
MSSRALCNASRQLLARTTTNTPLTPLARQSSGHHFHSVAPRLASYKRFGGQDVSQRSGLPANASNATIQQLLTQFASKGGGGGGGKRGGGGRRKGLMANGSILVVVAGLGGTYYVFHLEKVPSTGRWRFIDVSSKQEKQMGQESFQQILQENRGKLLPSSDSRVKYVHSVAEKILEAVKRSEHQSDHMGMGSMNDGGIKFGSENSSSKDQVEWEVFVIQDEQKNAFVLPNGKIFVYSGILPICKDQDGLATVLGHEIAHQLARHSAEKASGFKVLMFGGILLDMLGLDIGLSRAALTLLLSLPNSRKVEMEADKIGLQLMSMACFDPTKAPSLWQRMEASEGGEGGGGGGLAQSAMAIMSTHPLSHKRMESLQKWLPEAIETRNQAGCPNNAFMGAFQSTAKRANDSLSFS